MKKIIMLALIFIFSFSYAQDEKKVVVDLKTGDIKKFKFYLLSGLTSMAEYYKNNLEELKAVVVIHGDAYKFFIKDLQNSPYKNDKELKKNQTELGERLKNLSKIYHVRFEMCEIGMKNKKIPKESLYPFVKLSYSAGVSLVDWQNKGYAYLPIH